jgi:predicted nucleic acid-binding protein
MNEIIALDTNILVYFHSNDEQDKREIAAGLLSLHPIISTQKAGDIKVK